MPKKSHRINKRRPRGTRKHGGGRGRSRARRMRMKGGLRPVDLTNIRLQGTYSFANPLVQQEFKMFTFELGTTLKLSQTSVNFCLS